MKITGCIWLEEIVYKLTTKHNVSKEEIREVFRSKPKFRFIEKGRVKDEHLYAALGKTEAGRNLIVFFIYKKSREALIVSARDMTRKERERYDEK